MRSSKSIWGLVLLIIGGLFLASNFNLLRFDLSYVWRLWPLVFVFIGISILVADEFIRWIGWAASAVVIALVLVSGTHITKSTITDSWGIHIGDGQASSQSFGQDYDSATTKASFSLEAGAGSFTIKGNTDKLIFADTKTSVGSYNFAAKAENGTAVVSLKMGNSGSWHIGKNENTVNISLNANPLWDLDLNLGAASVDLDLSTSRVEKINLKSGASSQTIKFGDLADRLDAAVKTGASSVNVLVPKSVGAEINASTGLSSRNFSGFNKVSNTLYRSDGFENTSKKIYLNLEAGASSIDISRY